MGERWWQRGILYQVYPRSYVDANGDGVGDLPGVISRLDYLEWLGVDALWLSPIYPSPMKDFGYDVADYTGVDPLFGTLEDFDRLVAQARARGLKVVLDFVPNHTSDQHPWFRESGASRDNPKRDWYLWRDAPNNWLSNSAAAPGNSTKRPGSTTTTPSFRSSPTSTGATPKWCRRCSRCCASGSSAASTASASTLWHLVKDEHFADNPANPAWREGMDPYQALVPLHSSDRPEVHAVVAQLRRLLDEYPERVLIGEIYLPLERLMSYYGAGASGDMRGAHLPFNFQLLGAPWDARHLAGLIEEYERLLPPLAWPNWVLGNHDRPRVASASGRRRRASRRCCSSRCAARRPSTTATRSAWRTFPSRPAGSRIPSSAESRAWGSAATRCERRCSGARRRTPASRAASRGFRFHRITDW